MSWHTTVASLVLSTASAKASRRFLAAAPAGVEQVSSIALVCGGQRNGPAAGRLASCTRLNATHVVHDAKRPAAGPFLCPPQRSEEHTSELQSHLNLVCRLLLVKKKQSVN